MHAAPFGIFHVNLYIYTRVEYEDYIAASSVLALPHLLSKWILKSSLYLGCAKSQNLARLREIAKINTRKIIGTPKSQNFVLANNSTGPVHARVRVRGRGWQENFPPKMALELHDHDCHLLSAAVLAPT